MQKFLPVLAFFFSTLLAAQTNYVPNPSFEEDIGAPDIQKYNWNKYLDWQTDSLYSKKGNELILTSDWWQPTDGTPDYLNSKNSSLLGFRTKTARTGEGRMAIICGLAKNSLTTWLFYPDTYAEYIECRLNDTLTRGKMYRVQYYVALDKKSNFASDHFGACVTRDSITMKSFHESLWGDEPYANVMMYNDHFITSDEGWVLVCDTFIAKGGERYLTLGSFMGDFPKKVHQVKKSQHGGLRVMPVNKYSYYYVDDVSLTEVLQDEDLCKVARDTVARNNLVFLIDASGSMSENGLMKEAEDGIEALCKELPPEDHITIISYSNKATVLAEQIKASDTKGIHDALKDLKAEGATNAVAGFNAAYQSMRVNMVPNGTNEIIVFTDGKIFLPATEKKKITDASEQEGIKVSIVFYGNEVPDDVSKFAESTGGQSVAAVKGKTADALKYEVPTDHLDTPYGTRKVGTIIAWEFITKAVVPLAVGVAVLRAFRVI
jgi:hypothetical protein